MSDWSMRSSRGWRSSLRAMAWMLAIATAGVCLWGCGSGGSPVVVSIAGVPITKDRLEHWVRIEAITSWRTIPKEPAPNGVLPDPPSYSACIAWLGSAKGAVESRSLSVSQRKAKCAEHLQTLKQQALRYLMIYQWEAGQAKEMGINIPDSEVESNLNHFAHVMIKRKGNIEQYRQLTGMTKADMLWVERYVTTGDKINKAVQAISNPADIRRALAEFASKWVSRTNCHPGYVVPGCRQYHGSQPPL